MILADQLFVVTTQSEPMTALGPHSRRIMESLRAIEAGLKTFELLITKNQKDAIDGVRTGRYRGFGVGSRKCGKLLSNNFSRDICMMGQIGLFCAPVLPLQAQRRANRSI